MNRMIAQTVIKQGEIQEGVYITGFTINKETPVQPINEVNITLNFLVKQDHEIDLDKLNVGALVRLLRRITEENQRRMKNG